MRSASSTLYVVTMVLYTSHIFGAIGVTCDALIVSLSSRSSELTTYKLSHDETITIYEFTQLYRTRCGWSSAFKDPLFGCSSESLYLSMDTVWIQSMDL
ncbi:hypothetical protein MRX96_012736 [Rhipicephalus microplus]